MKKKKSPSSFLKFVKENISSKDFRSKESEAKINEWRNEYMTFFDEALEARKKKRKSPFILFQGYVSKLKKERGEPKGIDSKDASIEWKGLTDKEKEEFKSTNKVERIEKKYGKVEEKKEEEKKEENEDSKKMDEEEKEENEDSKKRDEEENEGNQNEGNQNEEENEGNQNEGNQKEEANAFFKVKYPKYDNIFGN